METEPHESNRTRLGHDVGVYSGQIDNELARRINVAWTSVAGSAAQPQLVGVAACHLLVHGYLLRRSDVGQHEPAIAHLMRAGCACGIRNQMTKIASHLLLH